MQLNMGSNAIEEVIKLLKEPGTGLGFKIMSGKKKENRDGIFVKSIIKGTPAYFEGRMKPCKYSSDHNEIT